MSSQFRSAIGPASLAMRNGHLEAVIFDFDGTLVDSYPLIEEAFAAVMDTHHLDEAARDLFRRTRGLPLPDQMKLIAPDVWQDLVATYRREDSRLGAARVFRGIPTLLQSLRRRHLRLGVVSSRRRVQVEAELEAIRLRPYFDVIIGYEDVTPCKPAPDPLLEAIARLGAARNRSVYIGDSQVDLATGRAARVRTVLAAWGHSTEMAGGLGRHRLRALTPRDVLSLLTLSRGNGLVRSDLGA